MIEKIHKCAIQELKGNKDFVLVNKQDFITLSATVNQIIEHLNNLEEKVNYLEPIKIKMQLLPRMRASNRLEYKKGGVKNGRR